MKYGFIKAAALSPRLQVADCPYNTQEIIQALQTAAQEGAQLVCLPEFALTGYTCNDLFLQRKLQQGALEGLEKILFASRELNLVALVGLPLEVNGKLYNCAAVLCRGELLGMVPKTHIPNYVPSAIAALVSFPVFHPGSDCSHPPDQEPDQSGAHSYPAQRRPCLL